MFTHANYVGLKENDKTSWTCLFIRVAIMAKKVVIVVTTIQKGEKTMALGV